MITIFSTLLCAITIMIFLLTYSVIIGFVSTLLSTLFKNSKLALIVIAAILFVSSIPFIVFLFKDYIAFILI